MSAFTSLIVLFIIASLAMCVVAYSNHKVEQTKKIRRRLQKLKHRAEALENLVITLDKICQNRRVCKIVNDEIISLYETMIDIDGNAGYLKAGLANATMRSEEFSQNTSDRTISRICNSDAHIARVRAYIREAIRIIRAQNTHGKVSSTEAQELTYDLEWLHLQVHVISNIIQGHKAYSKQDLLTANAFYKKAQEELTKSGHPDKRRGEMIKQINDLLYGRRKSLDPELMPETEFNPENIVLSEEQQDALEKLLEKSDPSMISEITSAVMQQTQAARQH